MGRNDHFTPVGKACAAAPAQAGGFDFIHDLSGLHGGHGFFEGLEAAVLDVNIQLLDIRNIAMTQKKVSHYFTSLLPSLTEPPFLSASINSIVLSTVMFS